MKKIINFGSLNIDHVYQVPHFVKPGETLSGTDYKSYCGGKGGNQSVALARAGLKVYHAGCIGTDGKILQDNLAENGVNVDYIKTVEQASGHAIIQVNTQGENAIILYPGANNYISLEMIDDIFSNFSPGDILLLQNEINNIPIIMKKAVKKSLKIVFNFAPFSTETAPKLPLHLLKILIINEIEGAGLSGQNNNDDIINTLTKCYPETIIVMTLGKEGAICIADGKISKCPSPDAEVIDTTCAGDTFIGFFLEAYLNNKSMKECLQAGCAAGALAVSRPGATSSIPSKHELIGDFANLNFMRKIFTLILAAISVLNISASEIKDSVDHQITLKAHEVEKIKKKARFQYPDKAHIAKIAMLIPDSTYSPAPPVSDREFWDKLADLKSSLAIIKKAVKCSNEPIPVITDDDYLDFSRTGSRAICDPLWAKRKMNLHNLVLAECLENKGRFLKPIEDYINSYLVMKTWVGPAHDRTLDNFHGKITGVDLMAVANANLLSASYSLLQCKLSEPLKKRLKSEIERRIINPYLQACRSGSIGNGFWWLIRTNNWNAVCSCGVVYSTIIMSESKEIRAEVIACALSSLKYFLQGFTDDGYCSEGIGYWTYGFGNYLTLGEVLNQYTNDKINIFKSAKVRKVAEYSVEFELVDRVFPTFADNSILAQAGVHARLAMARSLNIPLTSAKPDKLNGNMEQLLINNTSKKKVVTGNLNPKLRSWFDVSNVLVCRPKSAKSLFYASIKAGNNNEHHNHNDVGSYLLLIDGFMPNCDPGSEVYTSRTFSPRRYESRLLNSWGHPVPIVGGKLQSPGREFEGKVLNRSFTDAKDSILIDLKPAYELASLTKLERSFVFDRQANKVTVTDAAAFSKPETFGTAIITYGKFKIISTKEIYIYNDKTCIKVNIQTTGGEIKITPEVIKENNIRGKKPYRIGIDFTTPVIQASIKIKYEKTPILNDLKRVIYRR